MCVLLGDVEEGGNEAESEDSGGDTTGDEAGAEVLACRLAIHRLDFYQGRLLERLDVRGDGHR